MQKKCCPNCLNAKRKLVVELQDFKIYQCQYCKLWYSSSSPSVNELQEIYNQAEYWEHKYFKNTSAIEFKKSTYAKVIKKLSERFQSRGSLLDIGCGTGQFVCMAARENWACTGIDISDYAVEQCKTITGVEIIRTSIEEWNSQDRHYDIVTLWDVIEHVKNPRNVIEKCSSLLNMNGCLVIYTPNSKSIIRYLGNLSSKLKMPKSNDILKSLYSPYHLCYFNKKTLIDLLSQYGLRLIYDEYFPLNVEATRSTSSKKAKFINFLDETQCTL